MKPRIFDSKQAMGTAAARGAATLIAQAIASRGEANIVLATGASQFEMLAHLVTLDVDWTRVSAFHLDEYIGLPDAHPASFRRYLRERFVNKVPLLRKFHFVDGERPDPQDECERLGDILRGLAIDVACVGIGENGHLAFNDPPADFEAETPYLVVELDDACRRQQLGEGWFSSLEDVPTQAISMSIRQIMRSQAIVCTVPDRRKAEAVKRAVEGPVTHLVPASILQEHAHTTLYLDAAAASLLGQGAG